MISWCQFPLQVTAMSCTSKNHINLAISSCGCQNSGPSPPLSLMFRSIGKSDFNTNLRPDCAWRRRSCRWPATGLRVRGVPSTFGAPDFSFEFSTRIYSRWNPNKTTTSSSFLPKSIFNLSPTTTKKNRQHNPLPREFMSTPSPTIPPLPFPLPPAGPSWRREHLCNSRLRSDHSP